VNCNAIIRPLPFAAVAVLAVGCAKPPPTLSLAGRICVERPDLISATAVPLADDKPVKVTLDDKTPCLEIPGAGKAAHVAFNCPKPRTSTCCR
jgi:hypothetical protein